MGPPLSIGIAGSGFIARAFLMAVDCRDDMRVTRVLTRRDPSACHEFPRPDLLTNSVHHLVDEGEVIVECSGDARHATAVVDAALRAGRIVVTMDAEFHVTAGSHFVGRGALSEAHGDQPGSLAALAEDAIEMGFQPVVYGNRKGYYHPNPPREQMEFWAKRQGLSLDQVTAATDGTKMQIEQALVANGLGADMIQEGMLGPTVETMQEGGTILAGYAKRLGTPIADYVMAPHAPPGIFIVGEHDGRQQPYLEYLKLGAGPYYTLVQNHHLCHLEIPRTIRRMVAGGKPLLDNSRLPRFGVAAIAKRTLMPGERIERGIGSFELRGEAVSIAAHPDHLPIGLAAEGVVRRRVEPGQRLSLDDMDVPDSQAFAAWRAIARAALAGVRTG